ncbi:MAG: hypothetical protein HQK81_06315 [Desulfovibrionaceae bacterium]|nr:hypothetical protein [Desulfovibrionaceae bacterium]MBF0513663.1 hypothetical protein [Desulfovibrionaceae bacterium]
MSGTLEPVAGEKLTYKRPMVACNKPGKQKVAVRSDGPYCPGCSERCSLPGDLNPGIIITVTNKEA